MRLIDADAMLERLEAWNTKDNVDKALYNFALNRVIEQPTAYDVDKVVEELGEATWQYNPPFNDEPYRMVILSNKAVQIVRRGGIDD